MIIDAHNHPDWHKHDFEKFIANMDKNGIDKTWLLSWETPYGDFDMVFRKKLSFVVDGNNMVWRYHILFFALCLRTGVLAT